MFKQLLAIALVGAGIAPVIAPPVAVVVINAIRAQHPATGTAAGSSASGNAASGRAATGNSGAPATGGTTAAHSGSLTSNPSTGTASASASTSVATTAHPAGALTRARAGATTRTSATKTASTPADHRTTTSSGLGSAAATTQIRFVQTITGVVRAVDPVAGSVTLKIRSSGGTTVQVLHEVQGTVITRAGQEIQLIDVTPGSRVAAGVLPTGAGTVDLMQLAVISAG